FRRTRSTSSRTRMPRHSFTSRFRRSSSPLIADLPSKRLAPRLVFVNGGLHTGRCWMDTIDAIAARRPDVETVVVDLRGRRCVPGDLPSLTIDDCVSAVTRQIFD